mgnify:CR=1 FL=1
MATLRSQVSSSRRMTEGSSAPKSRRQFTRRMFAAHLGVAGGLLMLPASTAGGKKLKEEHLISGLRLRTGQPLSRMKQFYSDKLGLEIVEESEQLLTLATGASQLSFEYTEGSQARYHFAFNIPENQVLAAHRWQRERSELIEPPARLVDEGMPREVVAFRHWNAHSVFFHDPARNVVEYIARHDLDNADNSEFSAANSALCISEIGLVTEDVPALARSLATSLELETYVSSSEAFHPLGDQQGLILVMKRGGAMAFGKDCCRDIFPTQVQLNRNQMQPIDIKGHPYRLAGSDVDVPNR